ncbi:hypothetical protein [Aliiroseovarius zhejiangensis]|uniref:hypothetical protein n=1 Tax=Aliiroseovarius zhejiangensis TaxID=1632025 RepID=UPI00174D73AE|nr:hypothetical protein [Aliiroseovarius zhejiangensis]
MNRIGRIFEMLSRNQLLAWLGVSPFVIYLGVAILGQEFVKVLLYVAPLVTIFSALLLSNAVAGFLSSSFLNDDERLGRRIELGLWVFFSTISLWPIRYLYREYGISDSDLMDPIDCLLAAALLGFAVFYFSSGKADD